MVAEWQSHGPPWKYSSYSEAFGTTGARAGLRGAKYDYAPNTNMRLSLFETVGEMLGSSSLSSIDGNGGYIVNLYPSLYTKNQSMELLSALEDSTWLDAKTRITYVEFVVYNPQLHIACAVKLTADFTTAGGIERTVSIRSYRVPRYTTWVDFAFLVMRMYTLVYVVKVRTLVCLTLCTHFYLQRSISLVHAHLTHFLPLHRPPLVTLSLCANAQQEWLWDELTSMYDDGFCPYWTPGARKRTSGFKLFCLGLSGKKRKLRDECVSGSWAAQNCGPACIALTGKGCSVNEASACGKCQEPATRRTLWACCCCCSGTYDAGAQPHSLTADGEIAIGEDVGGLSVSARQERDARGGSQVACETYWNYLDIGTISLFLLTFFLHVLGTVLSFSIAWNAGHGGEGMANGDATVIGANHAGVVFEVIRLEALCSSLTLFGAGIKIIYHLMTVQRMAHFALFVWEMLLETINFIAVFIIIIVSFGMANYMCVCPLSLFLLSLSLFLPSSACLTHLFQNRFPY
jgi:hypothetical protein